MAAMPQFNALGSHGEEGKEEQRETLVFETLLIVWMSRCDHLGMLGLRWFERHQLDDGYQIERQRDGRGLNDVLLTPWEMVWDRSSGTGLQFQLLGKTRQERSQAQNLLGHSESSRPTWTWWDPGSKASKMRTGYGSMVKHLPTYVWLYLWPSVHPKLFLKYSCTWLVLFIL